VNVIQAVVFLNLPGYVSAFAKLLAINPQGVGVVAASAAAISDADTAGRQQMLTASIKFALFVIRPFICKLKTGNSHFTLSEIYNRT